MNVLHLDFETYSHTNLKAAGVWQHVQDPNFEITCLAWAFDDGPVRSISWPATKALPKEIEDHLRKGGEVHAWNAQFEYVVLTGHYGWALAHSKLVCTMQRALAYGLPGSLAEAGPALGLQTVKDVSARRLMLSMSKPKKDGSRWHHTDASKLAALAAYCERDVEAEREVGRHIPFLSEFERKVAWIDALSNEAGIMLDDGAIKALTLARETIRREQKTEVTVLTGGAVVRVESEVAKLQSWLKKEGLSIPSVNKEEVADVLRFPGSTAPHVLRVLELRQAASKSSLGKLDKMMIVRGSDGRGRGLLQYYGAGRTGRWAGRLVQVQNLPRNTPGVDTDAVLETIRAGDDGMGLFYERPLEALSACLRGCLTAAPGKLLAMIDLSQIEARVLAWLAGQADLVERFRAGIDPYPVAAASVGSGNRQLGKVMTLACQFGMGLDGTTFQKTAKEQYGLELTLGEASAAVYAYRAANPRICQFWWDLLMAAKRALGHEPVKGSHRVTGPLGGRQVVGRVWLEYTGRTFKIGKPNGEILYYHKPRIVDDEFRFWGAEQKTGAWMELRTYGGKFAENITQSVARDIMAEAMARIEDDMGMVPVTHVHDELVYEVETEIEAQMLQRLVDEVPLWAKGLPVASKLHTGFRYGK